MCFRKDNLLYEKYTSHGECVRKPLVGSHVHQRRLTVNVVKINLLRKT